MSTFTGQLWAEAATIRAAIHAMPFNRELAAGVLDPERFAFYVIQDALYLEAYARALALASAKAPDPDAQIRFAQAARGAIEVERALHAGFFAKLGVDPAKAARAERSPTCQAYTDYLIALSQTGDYPELIAAILPCFWIYWDVGQAIHKVAAPDNPYRAWIDTYADEGFGNDTRAVIALVDRAAHDANADTLARMRQAFMRCCQYEWMFWDSAYRQEAWPV